jgi:hypothetical protein
MAANRTAIIVVAECRRAFRGAGPGLRPIKRRYGPKVASEMLFPVRIDICRHDPKASGSPPPRAIPRSRSPGPKLSLLWPFCLQFSSVLLFFAGAFFAAATTSNETKGNIDSSGNKSDSKFWYKLHELPSHSILNILVVPGLLTRSIPAGSFGCSKARSKTEKPICASPALSKADDAWPQPPEAQELPPLVLLTQSHRPSNRTRYEVTETSGTRSFYWDQSISKRKNN